MRIIRFIAASIAFAILAMFFVAYGTNTGYNGRFSPETYWDSFVSAFGGLGSFMALVIVLALLGCYFLFLRTVGNRVSQDLSHGISTFMLLIAIIVSAAWVRIDLGFFGGLGPFVGFVVAAFVSTAIIGAILGYMPVRRRVVREETTDTAETTD